MWDTEAAPSPPTTLQFADSIFNDWTMATIILGALLAMAMIGGILPGQGRTPDQPALGHGGRGMIDPSWIAALGVILFGVGLLGTFYHKNAITPSGPYVRICLVRCA